MRPAGGPKIAGGAKPRAMSDAMTMPVRDGAKSRRSSLSPLGRSDAVPVVAAADPTRPKTAVAMAQPLRDACPQGMMPGDACGLLNRVRRGAAAYFCCCLLS